MKRLFLLIAVCMIGMVLPQGMWAETIYNQNSVTITIDNGTVTINCAQASKLSQVDLESGIGSRIADCSTIKFEGYFCDSDINSLNQNNHNYCTQSTVDMSKAHIVNYGGDENSHSNNYNSMSFQKWGSNVTTAITSKYMGPNDSASPDFISGCSGLTTLTLSSGKFQALNSKDQLRNLATVNVKQDVTDLGQGMFSGLTSITTVNFEDGENNLAIGEGCFNGCTGITSLNLPARLASLGKQAFANTTGVTSLSFHENSKITKIPEEAFKSCGNATQAEFDITIPRSVTEIQSQAFGDMWRLKKVRFTGQKNDADLVIKTGAFAGGTETNYILSDVFVDIDPEDRKLICEYGAFSYTSMEGQTNIEHLEELTTLHFNEKYWDYYAGDWKKGVTFDQAALNSFKDGCDPTKTPMNADTMIGTNEQINANNGHIDGKQPANGWQQFAKTSTGIDIIHEGSYFRTYSTDVPQVRPEWMHIYRITAFSDGFDQNNPNFNNPNSREQADAAEKKATAVEIKVENTGGHSLIPANTGMIRVDVVTEDALYFFMDFEDTGLTYNADWEYPYNEDLATANNQKLNFMYPTGEEDRIIGPVERGNDGKIKYRIFGLLKKPIEGTNRLTGQFSRAMNPTTLAKNRAYLKLPATLFHWTNESTGSSQNATGEATPSQYAKISLFFDDDFEELNGGIATEIINSIEEDMYKNDSFYTLQGVKVAKPTAKGVYIHNGKKILIK